LAVLAAPSVMRHQQLNKLLLC